MWVMGTNGLFRRRGREDKRPTNHVSPRRERFDLGIKCALLREPTDDQHGQHKDLQPTQGTMPSAAVLTIQTHLLTGFYKRPTFEKMGTTEGRSQEPPVWVDFAAEDAFLLYQSFREMHTKFIVWCVVRAMFLSLHLGTWTFPW